MLTRPEIEAVITMVCVVGVLLALWIGFSVFLPDIGVAKYSPECADNTKVSFEGTIFSQKITATGGHLILNVSNVTVFVQNGAENMKLLTGDKIKLTGTVSTYAGSREIVVDNQRDITILT